MEKELIERFNFFIGKAKCSYARAISLGYRMNPDHWNLDRNNDGKGNIWVIKPIVTRLEVGHRDKRLHPLSLVLEGKIHSGNKYTQLERMFGFNREIMSRIFHYGLMCNRDMYYDVKNSEELGTAYSIGIYFGNKIYGYSYDYYTCPGVIL